jgi:hypothetical protein
MTMKGRGRGSMRRFSLAMTLLMIVCAGARAEISPALKELAAAASKEGTLTLSWSQSTLAGSQGAARFQAAINRMFGSNIRINFVPGADMARLVNQLATEFSAGQKASADIALGAARQIAPVLKLDFVEPVDWRQYLPGRITSDMIELDAPPASTCCSPTTSGAGTRPSAMCARSPGRSPASFAVAKPSASPPANISAW